MSQEATLIVVDNSDFMRNGDFNPTRLQAQYDAVTLLCQCKRQANPENTIGLISLANTEVLCTLTDDISKIYNCLHSLQLTGEIKFCTSVRIAHLALRHRQLRHQKMRIICFVGSPISDDGSDVIKLAKRLKKEKVYVDVVSFGESETNQKKLFDFIDTINGKDGNKSHLVTVPAGSLLHESLASSPVIAGEDGIGSIPTAGMGLEFGLGAVEDPDLLYALRVSMEDQRMRQEHEIHGGSNVEATALPEVSGSSEEAMLRHALEVSMQVDAPTNNEPNVDFIGMSEEDQIAYAIRMSMQTQEETKKLDESSNNNPTHMEIDEITTSTNQETDDVLRLTTTTSSDPAEASISWKTDGDAESVYDPEFLQAILQTLPGVDLENEDVQKAISTLTNKSGNENKGNDETKGGDSV